MKKGKQNFIPLIDDKIFKSIYGDCNQADILYDLLKSCPVLKKYDLGNLESVRQCLLNNTKYNEHDMYADILVKANNVIVDVECQRILDIESWTKSKSYAYRIYSTQLETGAKYEETLPVVMILFVEKINQKLFASTDFQKHFYLTEEKEGFCYSNNDLHIYIYLVDKSKNVEYNEINQRFITHIKLLKAKSYQEMLEIAKGDEIFMKIEQALYNFINDKNTARIYGNRRIHDDRLREEGMKQGMTKGMKQGITQGILQNQENNARKMIEKGYDIQDISEITNLPMNQIENMKLELNKNY